MVGDRSEERCLLSAGVVSSRETCIITHSVVIGTAGDKTVMIIEIICIIFMTYMCFKIYDK